MDSELRGLSAGGGGRLEGIWGKGGGAARCGACLCEEGALGICGMGVVGGGLMWGIEMGAGGSGCSRGGWGPPCEDG